jgi:hypothetical protein
VQAAQAGRPVAAEDVSDSVLGKSFALTPRLSQAARVVRGVKEGTDVSGAQVRDASFQAYSQLIHDVQSPRIGL